MWPRGWGLLTALPSMPEPSGVPPPPRPDLHATGSQQTRVGETWAGPGAHGAHFQVSGSYGVTVGASSWPPCWGGLVSLANPQLNGTQAEAILGGTQASEDGSLGSRARSCAGLSPRDIPARSHRDTIGPRVLDAGRDLVGGAAPQLLGPPLVRPVWRGEVCPSLPGLVLLCRGVLSFFLALCRAHLHLPLADVNECATSNAGCEGECRNTVGGFYCSCLPGRQLRGDGTTCQGGSPAWPPAPARPWPQRPCSGCSLRLPPPHPWAALRRVLGWCPAPWGPPCLTDPRIFGESTFPPK